ncbi:BamA/TamA family outer membrane protein [bacterium]|nr:BamA/TamA family outer membrane protein [bacterium]
MRRLSAAYTLALIFGIAQVTAQPRAALRHIEFRGLTLFSAREAEAITGLRTGTPFTHAGLPGALERLDEACRERGYLFSGTDSARVAYAPDSLAADVTVWYREDLPALFEAPVIQENPWIDAGTGRDLLAVRRGAPFNEAVLEAAIYRLMGYFENSGYPLVRVEIASLDFVKEGGRYRAETVLKIASGPPVSIGRVAMDGNTITRTGVLVRETRLRAGDLFRMGRIRAAADHLSRSGYETDPDSTAIRFSGDSAAVTFRITRENSNTFNALAGYVPPRSEREKGYVTGEIDIDVRNLLGTGRQCRIYWEKKDQYTQTMDVRYREPWILNHPVDAGIGFRQEIQDTSYIRRHLEFEAWYRPFFELSAGLQLARRTVLPDSLQSVTRLIPESDTYALSLFLDYSTLDNPLNPARGVRLEASVASASTEHRGLSGALIDRFEKRNRLRSVSARFTWVRRISGPHVAYLHAEGHDVDAGGAYIPVSEHIRFGGAATLRGYREDMFSGTSVSWVNCEYRYLIGVHSRIFVFVDGGVYQYEDSEGRRVSGRRLGYGFGLRVATRLGLIGIDYGLGAGDRITGAKIHVRLVNRF